MLPAAAPMPDSNSCGAFSYADDRLADVEILPPSLSDEDAIARALTRSSNREGPFNAVEIWDGRRIVFRGCLSEATSGDGLQRAPPRQTQNDVAAALAGVCAAKSSDLRGLSQLRMSPASRLEQVATPALAPHIQWHVVASLSGRSAGRFHPSVSASPRPQAAHRPGLATLRSSTMGTGLSPDA